MKKFHPFFAMGSVGIIVIASLHMILALGLKLNSVHTTFFVLYPIFLTFMILGVVFSRKNIEQNI